MMDGIDLTVGEQLGAVERHGSSGRRSPERPRRRVFTAFRLCVILPTLASALYFFGFASPQYVSEAQFVVRGPGSPPPGLLNGLLQTAVGGASGGTEDTYAVQDFMTSRDAVKMLLRSAGLRRVFGHPGADFLARFPGLTGRQDFEHFFWYYQAHVTAELDTQTGISDLKVRTFDPADSQRIAQALVQAGERLINQMNTRQRENTIRSATAELRDAEARLQDIGAQIAVYRNKQSLLDPNKQSIPMLKDIADLQALLTSTRIQIAQTEASAPESPLLSVYKRRVDALEAQIVRSEAGITGSDSSLVPKITAYDHLVVQQSLIEKELVTDAAALAEAKAQADRQLLYLDEVVTPNLPDYAAFPKSLVSVCVVFLSLLGLYLMARLLIAGAREHQLV